MRQKTKGIIGLVATASAIFSLGLGTPQSTVAQNASGTSAVIGGAGAILPKGSGGSVSFRRISNLATEQIVFLVGSVGAFCARLPDDRYEVDCLADQYTQIAQTMSRRGDYGDARKAIDETARRLRGLAEANRSAQVAPARVADPKTRHASSRPVTPTAKRKTRAVKARAAEIIEEGRTKLLRSAERSQRRKVAYAQIADAMESNKVLLRSA